MEPKSVVLADYLHPQFGMYAGKNCLDMAGFYVIEVQAPSTIVTSQIPS